MQNHKPVNNIDWDERNKDIANLDDNKAFLCQKYQRETNLGVIVNFNPRANDYKPSQRVNALRQLFDLGRLTQGQYDQALYLFEAMDYLEARPPASSLEPRCGESDYDIEDDPRRDAMRARRKRLFSFIDQSKRGEIEAFEWVLWLGYYERILRIDYVMSMKIDMLRVLLQRMIDG